MGQSVRIRVVQYLRSCTGHENVEELGKWFILYCKCMPDSTSVDGR